MCDIYYHPAAQKKLIILFRAVKGNPRDSVQHTIRFLVNRVSTDDIDTKMPYEWDEARYWWERQLNFWDRQRLTLEYKFAAKIP